MRNAKLFLIGAALILAIQVLMSATLMQKPSGPCTYTIYHCNGAPICTSIEVWTTKSKGEARKHTAHGDDVVENCQ